MPRRSWALLVLLAAAAAPAADAQGPLPPLLDYRFDQVPTAPIQPQTEAAGFLAVVTVRCDAVLPAGGTKLLVSFDAPPGVAVVGPAELALDPSACTPPATTLTVRQEYQVILARTLPGLQAVLVQGQVTLDPAPPYGAAAGGNATPQAFTVVADYYPKSQVRIERKLKQCSPCDQVPFEAELTNFGNARTQYTFEVVRKPSAPWTLVLPDPVVLDPQASGKAVFLASGRGGEGSYGVVIHPVAADDPSKAGDVLAVNFLVRDTSLVSRATPGPAPLLAGLAALGVALSRRRA